MSFRLRQVFLALPVELAHQIELHEGIFKLGLGGLLVVEEQMLFVTPELNRNLPLKIFKNIVLYVVPEKVEVLASEQAGGVLQHLKEDAEGLVKINAE